MNSQTLFVFSFYEWALYPFICLWKVFLYYIEFLHVVQLFMSLKDVVTQYLMLKWIFICVHRI